MTRKQMAYRIIAANVDTFVFDIDCGDETLTQKSKDELVDMIYNLLLKSSASANHFKFLTAEWIKETIVKEFDKACRKWGVTLN